jgi:hypothetical protein
MRIVVACAALAGLLLLASGCTNPFCKSLYDYCNDCTSSSDDECKAELDDCDERVKQSCTASDISQLNGVGACIDGAAEECNSFGYLLCFIEAADISDECLNPPD